MAYETLTCQLNISADTLSALRDAALSQAEVQRLRAHIPTCAACRARLADFEAVASALRAQRELDPGDRVLEGVHARIAGQAGAPLSGHSVWNLRPKRQVRGWRLWTGLAALAPVAAIILLFVYVFAGVGHRPIVTSTPTTNAPSPTPTFFKQISPTATPGLVQVPTFTPAVPAAQAWPSFRPAVDITFKPSGTTEFIPDVFSSDLTTIGGVFFDTAGQEKAQLATYDIASHTITKLSPTWHGYVGPWGGVVALDSRYIVYGYNSEPGATCGVCHNTLWSLDRATGATWQINAHIMGDLLEYASGDHVVFTDVGGEVWVADLAARTVKVALPVGAPPDTASSSPGANERLLGFQWPYLMYAETPAATPPATGATTTLNILDLATGVNIPVTSPLHGWGGVPVGFDQVSNTALVGQTLYAVVFTGLDGVDAQGEPVNLTYSTLYRLDNSITSGGVSAGKFIAVAYSPGGYSGIDSPAMATRHLVWLGSGYFWDNAELRLVSTSLSSAQLVGSDIVTIQGEGQQGAPLQPYHALAYDTTGFPVPPGW